jgi:hypothetical protein
MKRLMLEHACEFVNSAIFLIGSGGMPDDASSV